MADRQVSQIIRNMQGYSISDLTNKERNLNGEFDAKFSENTRQGEILSDPIMNSSSTTNHIDD